MTEIETPVLLYKGKQVIIITYISYNTKQKKGLTLVGIFQI